MFTVFVDTMGESHHEQRTGEDWQLGTAFYLFIAVLGSLTLMNIGIAVVVTVSEVYGETLQESQPKWEEEVHQLMAS
jgi:hypothetical protein